MKRILIAAAGATLAVAALGAAPASAAVSVAIGQPGFYGRIDIGGGVPPPEVVYAQPVIIQQPAVQYQRAPIYLRVPPGQQQNWGRYCNSYNACGQPVYFVQDGWYNNVYAPHYREQYARDHRGGPPPGKGWRKNERDDRDDRGDRGNNGRGNGRGRD
jgi:hypothetical protein